MTPGTEDEVLETSTDPTKAILPSSGSVCRKQRLTPGLRQKAVQIPPRQ